MTADTRFYWVDVAAAIMAAITFTGTLISDRLGTSWPSLIVLSCSLVALVIGPRLRPSRLAAPVTLTGLTAALALALLVIWPWQMAWSLLGSAVCVAVAILASVKHAETLEKPVSRQDAITLSAIGLSTLFAATLAEVSARASAGWLPPEIQQALRADPRNYGVAHPYIGHLHTPNAAIVIAGSDFTATHHTDRFGFRNSWPWPMHADIVVVGDSVAFGYGAADSESWPARLEARLGDAKVMNLALLGGSPQQYLRVYETFGAQLHPKVVLVGLWAYNDLTDAEMFDDWERSGAGGNVLVYRDFGLGRRVTFDWGDVPGSVSGLVHWNVYPLLRRSYFYNLLRVVRENIQTRDAAAQVTINVDGGQLHMTERAIDRMSDAIQPSRRGFRLLIESLKRLQTVAATNGATMLVVIQPAKQEVYLPLVIRTVRDPLKVLRDEFRREQIDYLDLTPAFRLKAASGRRLYFERDSHPNPAGYAFMAETIAAHLRQSAPGQ